ncbi:hypothetical protein FACS1894133_1340 [Clostridia bacterium]|nr:hypothetical protein FACS1894133_1340 [Clostridia bacterium]
MKDDLTGILELDKVLRELARYCVSEDVKAAAESLSPFCACTDAGLNTNVNSRGANSTYAGSTNTGNDGNASGTNTRNAGSTTAPATAAFRTNISDISLYDTSASQTPPPPAATSAQPATGRASYLRPVAEVKRELAKVRAAGGLSARFGDPAFAALLSPVSATDRARKGQTLTLPELRKIGRTASQVVYLNNWYENARGEYEAEPLSYLFEDCDASLKRVAERLERCITADDELSDEASPGLTYIRGKLKRARSRIRVSLEKILKDKSKFLQEQLITTRDGRYVIPVRAEHKNEFGGFVHDVSGSGATLFIEPADTVEQSNEIRLLLCEEEEEVRRVLRELSEMCGGVAREIIAGYTASCELELCFAKSAYGRAYSGVTAVMTDDARLSLTAARHPLLLLRLGKDGVVPVDIGVGGTVTACDELWAAHPNPAGRGNADSVPSAVTAVAATPPCGQGSAVCGTDSGGTVADSVSEYGTDSGTAVCDTAGITTSLIITGANAGGKTAALKTAGLLTLMCYCGLMLPADETSEVGTFTRVFADIGDNQSLEANLSTFSAHMSNISQIAAQADNRSLILLDELASGTDPAPGGALAVSLLEYFKSRGSRVIATSHYKEVKVYAVRERDVAIACSEFDTATLAPTYRLIHGIPGKSYTFDVARRYDIPRGVLARAEEQLRSGDASFEDAIAAVNAKQSELSGEAAALATEKKAQFELNVKLKQRLDGIEREKDRAVAQAKREADKMIANVTAEAELLIREINENIATAADTSGAFAKAAKSSRNRVKSRTGKMRDIINPVTAGNAYADSTDEGGTVPALHLQIGGEVKLKGTGVAAVVVTLPDKSGNLTVQTGHVKVKTNVKSLSESNRTETAANVSVTRTAKSAVNSGNSGSDSGRTRLAGTELDVRGCTASECLYNVEKFIDGAVMDGHRTVTIIHGKGGGTLRKACENFLRGYALVASCRAGEYGEGDTGVTVVTLK